MNRKIFSDVFNNRIAPQSPPTSEGKYSTVSDKALNGTLRVYETAKAGASVLAVFSGVTGYRDMSIEYAEEVAREEGAVIWKSDKDGYKREEKVSRASDWVTPVIGPGRKVSPGRKNSDDEL